MSFGTAAWSPLTAGLNGHAERRAFATQSPADSAKSALDHSALPAGSVPARAIDRTGVTRPRGPWSLVRAGASMKGQRRAFNAAGSMLKSAHKIDLSYPRRMPLIKAIANVVAGERPETSSNLAVGIQQKSHALPCQVALTGHDEAWPI